MPKLLVSMKRSRITVSRAGQAAKVRRTRGQEELKTELLPTKPQREALDRLVRAGESVLVNDKGDGFCKFRSGWAIALLIAGAAEIKNGELRLTTRGQMLSGEFA
jgi:hypothetical protein